MINAIKNNVNRPKISLDLRQNPLENCKIVKELIQDLYNLTLQVDAR